VLLTVVGVLLLRNAAGPAVAPTRLAVLPFSVRGDAEFQYLSEGIGDLLARSLDGVGDLRTVDPSAVLSALGLDGSRAPATPQYRAVARRVGAGLYLLGSVNVIGGRLRIQAGLYDATAEATADALSQHGVEGAAADVLALVDQLAARLMVERGGTPGRVFETAALTTHSLAALRQYLTAEHLLRSGPGRVDSAIAGFQRAVAEDSTFALAHYRLAVAAGWNGRQALATAATAAAVRHSTRLADRDRRLLSGYHQYRSGLVENAEQSFRALTRDYPDNLEAEFQLADLLLYYNPIRGRSLEEPRVLFDRVLAFDPGFL
jgi:TolB-like protein